jgi:hypothetical protein
MAQDLTHDSGPNPKDEGGRMKDEKRQKDPSDSSFIPHPFL